VSDPRIELKENPTEADRRVIVDGLLDFNRRVIGEPDERELAVVVRDAQDQVVGGLLGHVRWRWLYVSKLWLPEALRGKGIGTRLMREVEAYAKQRDCDGVFLDTFEYQALPFYEKLGYEQFGTLEGYPPGYRQFYLRKTLRSR
jgi:GNAT superfamily N-acetyltransferase